MKPCSRKSTPLSQPNPEIMSFGYKGMKENIKYPKAISPACEQAINGYCREQSVCHRGWLGSSSMAELRGTKMPSVNKPALFTNSKEESKGRKIRGA